MYLIPPISLLTFIVKIFTFITQSMENLRYAVWCVFSGHFRSYTIFLLDLEPLNRVTMFVHSFENIQFIVSGIFMTMLNRALHFIYHLPTLGISASLCKLPRLSFTNNKIREKHIGSPVIIKNVTKCSHAFHYSDLSKLLNINSFNFSTAAQSPILKFITAVLSKDFGRCVL